MQEFDIIDHFFTKPLSSPWLPLGIGDDAAIIRVPSEHDLVSSIDTLVAGIHFPLLTAAADIGYKSLAVSLSDIAAMGAQPFSVLLALTMPIADPLWLTAFTEGFFSLARQFQVDLIGGDLTQGPLSISTQVNGIVPTGQALCRHHAQPGDDLYVTGTLGDAGYALHLINTPFDYINPQLLNRLNRPEPRIAAGLALRELAHAAIDISDGLVSDLGHLLQASRCGACVYTDKLPLSAALINECKHEQAIQYALYSGDDYELCFTAAPKHRQAILQQKLISASRIGTITTNPELKFYNQQGELIHITQSGYQHFTS